MDLDTHKRIDNNSIIEVATPPSDSVACVLHGDSFAFDDFLSPEQHIELLKKRGLGFKNSYEEQRFLKLINTIGYYRLSQ